MAVSIRNIEKFIDDTAVLRKKKASLMARAREIADSLAMGHGEVKEILGDKWSVRFFQVVISNPNHIKIGLEDLGGRFEDID